MIFNKLPYFVINKACLWKHNSGGGGGDLTQTNAPYWEGNMSSLYQ